MVAYLDHAAATPIRPAAANAWNECVRRTGNASSLHGPGRRARRIVEESRESIAERLGVAPDRIVFTSGGTEANSLGVIGTHLARSGESPERRVIIAGAIEHKSVLESARAAAGDVGHVATVRVDREGRLDTEHLSELLDRFGPEVSLVAVMWANNEVGTIQPIADVVTLCAAYDVPLHVDAVQAIGTVAVSPQTNATTAVSGHKLGGPPGTGLLVTGDFALKPVTRGGGQERGIRSGTLNTPGIAGLAAAMAESLDTRKDHEVRVRGLRDALVEGVGAALPDAIVNSPRDGLPGLANFTFPGCAGEALLMALDAAGVVASTGSACDAGIARAGHVLAAMGVPEAAARQSIRFSLGWSSSWADVADAVAVLPEAVARARHFAGVTARSR